MMTKMNSQLVLATVRVRPRVVSRRFTQKKRRTEKDI